MMRAAVVVCLLASNLVLSAPAVAQIATGGSVRGHVKDEQDAALPGVRVTATSPDTPARYSATSDSEGYYRLLDLPPGEYTVAAELDGFATWMREAVVVRGGLNINVPVVMRVGALTEVIEVRTETPTLEISRPSQSMNVSGEFQRSLPISTRRMWTDALQLAPGVVQSVSPGFYYVHGSNQDSHVFQVDGMDVMSSRQSNSTYMNLNNEAIADVEVKTAAVDASSPLGVGAVVNVAATSGTDTFQGSASITRQPLAWNGNNDPLGRPGKLDAWQSEGALGGPVRRGAHWFFGSFRYAQFSNDVARTAQQLSVLRALRPGFEPFAAVQEGPAYFVKTTHRLSDDHQLTGMMTHDYLDNQSGDPTTDGSYYSLRVGGPAGGARLTSTWGASALTRLLVSHNAKGVKGTSARRDIPGVRVHERAFLSEGRLTGTGTLATLGNSTTAGLEEPSAKTTIAGDLTVHSEWLGSSHELQAGFYWLPYIKQDQISTFRDNGVLLEDAILRDPADPAAGIVTYRRQVYDQTQAVTSALRSRDIALYVQDRWSPINRLTISAGVRIDWLKRTDTLFDQVTQDSVEVGPRFGANVALTENGRHVVRGSWSRVHENLTVVKLTSGTVVAGFTDFYDNDLNGSFETVLATPARTQAASDRVIDDDYHQPFAQEWTLGYGSQWPGQVTVDIGLTGRVYRDRTAAIEINGIYDGGVFRGFRDETLNQVRRVTNNRWNEPVYTGLHTSISKQSRRLRLIGSWARQWRHMSGTWEPNEPVAFLQPATFANDRGIGDIRGNLAGDAYGTGNTFGGLMWRDHLVQAGASLQLPLGIQVAAHYMVQSGHWSGPILTRAAAPDPAVGPPIVQLSNGRLVSNPLATTLRFAYSDRGEGQFRSPEMRRLNLRIGHEHRVGGRRLRFSADLLNATNSDADQTITFGSANQLFSPLYRTMTSRVAPRSVQVSAGVVF